MILPWRTPDDTLLLDHHLYLVLHQEQIVPGAMVWHADKRKFFLMGMEFGLSEIQLLLPLWELDRTLPEAWRKIVLDRQIEATAFRRDA